MASSEIAYGKIGGLRSSARGDYFFRQAAASLRRAGNSKRLLRTIFGSNGTDVRLAISVLQAELLDALPGSTRRCRAVRSSLGLKDSMRRARRNAGFVLIASPMPMMACIDRGLCSAMGLFAGPG